jgi:hypothetical protein
MLEGAEGARSVGCRSLSGLAGPLSPYRSQSWDGVNSAFCHKGEGRAAHLQGILSRGRCYIGSYGTKAFAARKQPAMKATRAAAAKIIPRITKAMCVPRAGLQLMIGLTSSL